MGKPVVIDIDSGRRRYTSYLKETLRKIYSCSNPAVCALVMVMVVVQVPKGAESVSGAWFLPWKVEMEVRWWGRRKAL
jgi:hypothetical protein